MAVMISGMFATSLPSRGAWIEIEVHQDAAGYGKVAPLAGSVDRNDAAGAFACSHAGRSPRGERG